MLIHRIQCSLLKMNLPLCIDLGRWPPIQSEWSWTVVCSYSILTYPFLAWTGMKKLVQRAVMINHRATWLDGGRSSSQGRGCWPAKQCPLHKSFNLMMRSSCSHLEALNCVLCVILVPSDLWGCRHLFFGGRMVESRGMAEGALQARHDHQLWDSCLTR